MPNFNQFDLSATILQAIKELGFEKPTPVQRKVLPLVIKNSHDLVVLAQTGTGKTAAYGLPLLQVTKPENRVPQTLILCPTRELCVQITDDLFSYSKYNPEIRVVAVYGGTSMEKQISAIKRGVHIIVATPGRINDLIRRKCVKLATVEQLVLDEADEMLDMGFQDDLETIMSELPKNVRRLLFSATMSAPIAAIASKHMNKPEEVICGQKNAGSDNVSHECYTVHERDRYEALKRILDFHRNIYGIVFCRTRAETQDVASGLMIDGYSAEPLHGDLTQDQRDRVMRKFRSKELKILVATDVAARGIDVNDLTHVINYNLPDESEAYTHRSGRTGRAGKEGVSIVISNKREDHRIRNIERIIKKQFTYRQVPSGHAVCESQLMGLLEKIMAVDIKNKQLDSFMPAITAALKDIPSEEVVRRFLLIEFERFLEYYKDAPDLNQGKSSRDQKDRPREKEKIRDITNCEMVGLEINFGRRDKFTPPDLIGMINRAVRGPKIPLGRIRVMDESTSFEVPADAASTVLNNLNAMTLVDLKISVRMIEGGGVSSATVPRPKKPSYGKYRK